MLDSSHFLVRTLIDDGVVTDAEVERAQKHASANSSSVVESMVTMGIVSSRMLAICRAKICEYPFVDLGDFEIDIQNASLIPRSVAESLVAFPLFQIEGTVTVAMQDPLNLQAIDQLRQLLKQEVDPVLCDTDQLLNLISRAYTLAPGQQPIERVDDEEDLTTGDEPIVAAVNQIIEAAADAGASDIHICPDEHDLHLRYRIDGTLIPQQGPPRSTHEGIVQRLKVMAKLDLTQTRKPQDGKIRIAHRGQNIDLRLSLLPTIHGENVVMRLLRPAAAIGDITSLNMPEDMTGWFGDMISRPHGIILVTGPTGSGKTTTLYTAISQLNTPDRNVMTIEDPVEIRLNLVRQIQANAEVGLTFASALRSILRQDPDVVLVGEIRDAETARIAVQAALTGHLVFSTLHTNDAIGSIARLKDFDIPVFAINNALLGTVAQRLVRRNCEECIEPAQPHDAVLTGLDIPLEYRSQFKSGCGCQKCMSTGYRGRVGVFEMLRITPRVQKVIERDGLESEIRAAARLDGMRSMLEDGIDKALKGITSVEELGKLRGVIETAEEDEQRAAA